MGEADLDPKNKESIDAALSQDWERALKLNLELQKSYPKNINILNRLAHSHLELGQLEKAKATYNKALKLDPYNQIANKNLKNLTGLKSKDIKKSGAALFDPKIFLEEPGKTKVLNLEDVAMPKILAPLRTGDQLKLTASGKDIIIFSKNGSRLGKLDPDWSDQIATALRAGSRFEAYLKSIQLIREGTSLVTVFVKETHRAGKLANKPPFPSESTDFTPYVREGTLNYLNEIVTQTDEEIDEESDITEVKESRTDVPESIERLAEAEDESNFDEE
ncbi:MAG: hypothetical protein A2864_01195 [Candidatus Woykebacteria bacterium RIFCSPHIGHO2_01_FULL_39_12]|uniref:Uncharacterized protein n=1 Tax=Candidatus Woykebacteria bacterium RIFCSPHIGHO2_01_FULL_39_12 TaxID=1802599 RepID=A0A1G1WGX4_9BACT|nr:MAG: hypothetical protein A2864_01195 [Candidatus Woykebacteria bacterium RIFCSPHIGHO2_01_FULL_39_12]